MDMEAPERMGLSAERHVKVDRRPGGGQRPDRHLAPDSLGQGAGQQSRRPLDIIGVEHGHQVVDVVDVFAEQARQIAVDVQPTCVGIDRPDPRHVLGRDQRERARQVVRLSRWRFARDWGRSRHTASLSESF